MNASLRIISWNIRKAVGLDWRRDPVRVLRVLKGLQPDIVLLQEADQRLHPRPPAIPLGMAREAGWTILDADPTTPSIGHHGNAILLAPGLEVTQFEAIGLPGLEPRGAVLAEVVGGHRALTVGALHFGLRRKDRLRQMHVVLEAAERIGAPTVLGGDLNEWRQESGFLSPSTPWREFAPGPSFHAAFPKLSLDRFIVSSALTVLAFGVADHEKAERASDHLPIWIEIDHADI